MVPVFILVHYKNYLVPSTQSWLVNARYNESKYAKGATSDLLCSRRQYYAVEMKTIMSGAAPGSNPLLSSLDVSWVPGAQDLVSTIWPSLHDEQRFLRVDSIAIASTCFQAMVMSFLGCLRRRFAVG